MSALNQVLEHFRTHARTEREKGTYFEQLIQDYLRHEPSYHDLYSAIWTYAEWATNNGLDARDAGIDLVARTHLGDLHAIQCKFYAPNHVVQKRDIDSFFTASGKRHFSAYGVCTCGK